MKRRESKKTALERSEKYFTGGLKLIPTLTMLIATEALLAPQSCCMILEFEQGCTYVYSNTHVRTT